MAESLNPMAAELDEKIRTLTRERNEREAVLSSMVEGVLAVDAEERVIAVNEAAAAPARHEPGGSGRAHHPGGRAQPRPAALRGAEPLVSARAGGGRIGCAWATRTACCRPTAPLLRGAAGGLRGAVVVLNDVTRLKRLEGVRRDFVANVSHELKTPVTSIKGFAETLEDGALDDRREATRFVRIIAGQADRLNSIIEDLLALSTLGA